MPIYVTWTYIANYSARPLRLTVDGTDETAIIDCLREQYRYYDKTFLKKGIFHVFWIDDGTLTASTLEASRVFGDIA